MQNPRLYITYRSPYGRKVRIAMLEKGFAFDEIVVDLSHRSPEFLALNPTGTVPTLETTDGLVLTDSTLILHYLESLTDYPSLLPADARAKWETWNWEELADRLCEEQIAIFFEKARPEVDRRPEIITRAEAKSREIMATLLNTLVRHDYLMDTVTLADIAMSAVCNWMSFRLGKDWSTEDPAIDAWLARLNLRESFKNTVPRL